MEVCPFAERFGAPHFGACAQDWHTSQALWVLFPSSWRIFMFPSHLHYAFVEEGEHTQKQRHPMAGCTLTPQEGGEMNEWMNEWCCRSDHREFTWNSVSVVSCVIRLVGHFLTCAVRGAWLCHTRNLLAGGLSTYAWLGCCPWRVGGRCWYVGPSWMAEEGPNPGAGVF